MLFDTKDTSCVIGSPSLPYGCGFRPGDSVQRHRGRLHGIAYRRKQGVPAARAQDERPRPVQLGPPREVLRRHAHVGLPWARLVRHPRRPRAPLRGSMGRQAPPRRPLRPQGREVRQKRRRSWLVPNQLLRERGAARGSASCGVSRRVAAIASRKVVYAPPRGGEPPPDATPPSASCRTPPGRPPARPRGRRAWGPGPLAAPSLAPGSCGR